MAQHSTISKMETVQTAVDWLVEQIKSDQNQKALSASEWMQVIKQAKQIEWEQMEKAYKQPLFSDCQTFDQYYTKTYGNNQNK